MGTSGWFAGFRVARALIEDAEEPAPEMAANDATYYMPYQYGNPANPLAHYNGTALEILQELDEVSAFVAGLGTGAR